MLELTGEDRNGFIALLQILAAIAMAAIAGRELARARATVDDPEGAMEPVVALDGVGVHYRDLGMGPWHTLRWEDMVAIEWAGDNIGVRRTDEEVEMVDVATLSEEDRRAVEQIIRQRLDE